jgi:hypothetical protein
MMEFVNGSIPERYKVAWYTNVTLFFIVAFGLILNSIVIALIGVDNRYVGNKCLCTKSDFELINSTTNGKTVYEIEYQLFCEETSDFDFITLRTFSSYEEAYSVFSTVEDKVEIEECCVNHGKIYEYCRYTVLGALGNYIVFIAVSLSIWMGLLLKNCFLCFTARIDKWRGIPLEIAMDDEIELGEPQNPLINKSQ